MGGELSSAPGHFRVVKKPSLPHLQRLGCSLKHTLRLYEGTSASQSRTRPPRWISASSPPAVAGEAENVGDQLRLHGAGGKGEWFANPTNGPNIANMRDTCPIRGIRFHSRHSCFPRSGPGQGHLAPKLKYTSTSNQIDSFPPFG